MRSGKAISGIFYSMKFTQLKIGQRFRHKEKNYTKSGPIQAVEDGSSSQQMMMRSYSVELLDAENQPQTKTTDQKQVDREAVRSAVEAYHQQCLATLKPLEATQAAETARQLTDAYRKIIQLLD